MGTCPVLFCLMAMHSPRSVQPAHHQKSKRASLQPRRSHDLLLACVSAVTSQGLNKQRCTQRLHPPHPDLFDPCGWERCDNADEELGRIGESLPPPSSVPHPTAHPHALRVRLARSIKKTTTPSFIPSHHHPAPPAWRRINATNGATLHHRPRSCWLSHFFPLTCTFFTCFFSPGRPPLLLCLLHAVPPIIRPIQPPLTPFFDPHRDYCCAGQAVSSRSPVCSSHSLLYFSDWPCTAPLDPSPSLLPLSSPLARSALK